MKKQLLALSLFAACSAHASTQDAALFYIGGGYGNTSDIKLSHGTPNRLDASEKTKRIYAGIRFNRFAGIEGQYTDYGNPKAGDPDFSSFTVLGNFGYTTVVGLRPFVNLGLGITSFRGKQRKANQTEKDGRPSVRYGFGLEYTPPQLPQVSVRLASEHDRVFLESDNESADTPTADLGSVYLGISYNLY